MNRYTIDLFDIENQWHYEATCDADDLAEAWKIARRDYADKRTKIKNVTRA